MADSLTWSIFLAVSFLILFGVGEGLYYKFKVKAEFTRKFIHAGTGVITLLFPLLLSSQWYVLALCSSFALILILSKKYGLLKSINAIDRKSQGSLLYPVSVYLCFLVYSRYGNVMFFYIPILILALADPVAALSGKKWNYGKYNLGTNSKTLVGSAMFFITACLVTFACLYFTGNYSIRSYCFTITLCGFLTTFAEAISGKGFDNLTIPLAVLIAIGAERYMGII